MGSGKTAIGNAVAKNLDVPFLDSDHEITQAANMSIAEIFERDGEEFFREKETQVIERLLKSAPGILSTGGGAWLRDTNQDLIRELGVSLWLRADLDLLWSRVRHKDTRPLLRVPDPHARLSELYQERTPIYERAEIAVDAKAEYSIDDMAKAVIDRLLKRSDLLVKVEIV